MPLKDLRNLKTRDATKPITVTITAADAEHAADGHETFMNALRREYPSATDVVFTHVCIFHLSAEIAAIGAACKCGKQHPTEGWYWAETEDKGDKAPPLESQMIGPFKTRSKCETHLRKNPAASREQYFATLNAAN